MLKSVHFSTIAVSFALLGSIFPTIYTNTLYVFVFGTTNVYGNSYVSSSLIAISSKVTFQLPNSLPFASLIIAASSLFFASSAQSGARHVRSLHLPQPQRGAQAVHPGGRYAKGSHRGRRGDGAGLPSSAASLYPAADRRHPHKEEDR